MNKKLKIVMMALCIAPVAMAQNEIDSLGVQDEQAFTFTEAQLGEDDDMSQNVTITGSNSNIYASQVGYLFSPMRFRYRALNQKYNDIYINGVQMNDMETGQFRYSIVGGLNQQTRGMENSLPFEDNNFSMSGMAGSNNYNFRPSAFATGQRITLSGANRNYTLRGMYTYNSGVKENGWAYSANLTYRWANMNTSYVKGTFYNALSYFFGVEKFINDQHHLSLVTWGNPTERASQGAATDEMYWLANDRYYNPYWGFQNGKKRNSRVVNDFAPTALFTWDWNINDQMKLVTTLTGRYSMYKSTKLNYNNADNPHPNYWKNLPSSYFDVWFEEDANNRTEAGASDWLRAKNLLSGYQRDRQIDFDKLYLANRNAAAQGADAMYYIQAKHNDNLNIALSSNLNYDLSKDQRLNLGFQLATNKGMHYQTMDDLMGATVFHNINTYALGTYATDDPRVQYDANNPNAVVREGDKFGYDYNLFVNKANVWMTYAANVGSNTHAFISGRIGGVEMQREGKMKNGMFLNNSYGKSNTAHFLEGGGKTGAIVNLGHGHSINGGFGIEVRAPQAQAAFVSPEMNNDFVVDLKNEKNYSAEIGYQMQNSWLKANIIAYGAIIEDATEWQNFYFDDINSFSYVSMTGMSKEYYGVEWGLNFKLTDAINIKTLGTVSEARNTNNAQVWYMSSTKGTFNDANNGQPEIVYNKNMREAGTPLTALSLILSYHKNGWFIDLNGNWYDRIYLSYSPSYRYQSTLDKRNRLDFEPVYDNNGNVLESAVAQAKGKGGFMLDASIGKSLYLSKGRSMSINLMITNLLNNQKIVTGGYEQSRSSYTSSDNVRAYQFQKNPFKYYAYGINGMLNIAYKF